MFETFDSVISTMDRARANVAAGRVRFDAKNLPDSAGVLARTQTGGRGQRGRTWQDVPGESLCATYYLRLPNQQAERAGEIAFLAGAAVAIALEEFMAKNPPEPCPRIGLKWPNDILLNGKKSGGILIETSNDAEGQAVALIGLGLNVLIENFPPELAASATSFIREGIRGKTPEQWAETICEKIRQTENIRQAQGFSAVLNLWQKYDATPGRRYETEINGETTQGIAAGIAPNGALLLSLNDGQIIAVESASSLREMSREK